MFDQRSVSLTNLQKHVLSLDHQTVSHKACVNYIDNMVHILNFEKQFFIKSSNLAMEFIVWT